MRLRFRGASWSDSDISSSTAAPRAPVGELCRNRYPNPLPSLSIFLQADGAPVKLPTFSRAPGSADLAQWPSGAALQQGRNVQGGSEQGFEEDTCFEGPKAMSRHQVGRGLSTTQDFLLTDALLCTALCVQIYRTVDI